jgi:hypothetical protein
MVNFCAIIQMKVLSKGIGNIPFIGKNFNRFKMV